MNNNNKKGFTLLEVLISNALALILLIGLSYFLLNAKNTFNHLIAINEIQENGRFAIFFLNRELRMSGFSTCIPASEIGLEGYASSAAPKRLQIKPRQKTDVIVNGRCQILNNRETFVKTAFFVSKTSHNTYGLFMKHEGKQRQELVPNVEAMRVIYGIANQDAIIKYVPAASVHDWSLVKSVEITLWLTATNNKQLQKKWNTFVALREQKRFGNNEK